MRPLVRVLVAVLTLVAIGCGLQVRALEQFLATVAFGVSSARFAQGAAVLALRHWPPLLVDVLEWPVWTARLAALGRLRVMLVASAPRLQLWVVQRHSFRHASIP